MVDDFEEDWASVRLGNTPTIRDAALDLTDDRRELLGIPEFGYVVNGQYWGELAVWKVRIHGLATSPRRRPHGAYKIERVELLWNQPRAKTDKTYVYSTTPRKEVTVFRTDRSLVYFTLMDVSCQLGSLRDKARTESLYYRVQLQETLLRTQESIEATTKKLSELDKFNPNAVLPSDLLEAEDAEIERMINSTLGS